jgi:hypothetical protein
LDHWGLEMRELRRALRVREEREEKRGLRSRETETVREPSVRLTSEAVTKWGAFLLTESEVRHVREREKKEMRSDSW